MKRVMLGLIVTLVSLAAYAGNPSWGAVAAWTPPRYANDAISHWTPFADSTQSAGWFAFVRTRNPRIAGVVVKTAYKGLSGDVTEMDILNGQVLCGSAGEAPDYIHEADSMTFRNVDGRLVPVGDTGFVSSMALTPGTNLAEIVQKTCKMLSDQPIANAPSVAAGKCSALHAQYPIMAAREGHQGVVKVGFDIGIDERPDSLSVDSSSGFQSLDQAALQAVAQTVCNMKPGVHADRAITFSLNTTH